MDAPTMQASDRGEGSPSPRSGDRKLNIAGMTVPYAAGALTLGALVVLIVVRRSFAGALGD